MDYYIILGVIALVVLIACIPSRKEVASWRPGKREKH
jgi:hypothetical protein